MLRITSTNVPRTSRSYSSAHLTASRPTEPRSEQKLSVWFDRLACKATEDVEPARKLTLSIFAARFRIKKKQWTLNLERTISDLSGRVEELEREASELRRENGWLKEIVMLKSKRFAGVVPDLEPPPPPPPPQSPSGSASAPGPGPGLGGGGAGSGAEGG